MIKDEWRAMVLRLLVQILVKVHAGPQWGKSESEVMELVKEAVKLADAVERGESA